MIRAVQDALRGISKSCYFPENSSDGGRSQSLEWDLFWALVLWKGTEQNILCGSNCLYGLRGK